MIFTWTKSGPIRSERGKGDHSQDSRPPRGLSGSRVYKNLSEGNLGSDHTLQFWSHCLDNMFWNPRELCRPLRTVQFPISFGDSGGPR